MKLYIKQTKDGNDGVEAITLEGHPNTFFQNVVINIDTDGTKITTRTLKKPLNWSKGPDTGPDTETKTFCVTGESTIELEVTETEDSE